MTRIFISYGRKDTAAFAHKLADWLRAQGYEPWLDVENGIPVGAPFDLRIEVGIRESDAVVALLSPWSLRPEGFCRNEILYAQNAGRPIIPVRLADVVPPIQIISLNYIDAAGDPDLVFGELPDAIRRVASGGGMGYRQWGATPQTGEWWTRLQPDRFEEELARHGGSFVGREWLFDDVRAWATKPDSRLLLVTADAGFGKSAAAAQMSARLNVRGVHFCTRSIPESCRPDRWLGGLVYQLAAQFPAYREVLAALPAEPNWAEPQESLFRKLIADPLRAMRTASAEALSVDEPWVFIVDALDEAWAEAGPGMVELLVDSAHRVPDFLRIVVTCRPDRDILAQFRLDGVQCRHLDASGEPNRRDLQTYIERRLEALRISAPISFPAGNVAQLVSLADGNFLFAKLSLDALSDADPDSRLSFEDISALKPELGGLYCAMFRKRFRDPARYERELLPLLELLLAAQGPIPETVLKEASGLDARTASRGIAALSQFLAGGASGLRLFHQSLADWLCDPESSAHFLVLSETGHERLAEIGWREVAEGASRPQSYSLAPYTLAHLPAHLTASSQWDRLTALLTDLRYVEQRVMSGQVFDLVRDYNVANTALPDVQAGRRDRDGLDARTAQWSAEMVEYAARWSARRDRMAAGSAADGPAPVLPAPVPTCRMWTEEEIQAECNRIIGDPTRADRVDAFTRFVSSQCYPLMEFGGRPGFVRQHAFNWEPAGPVRATAAAQMSGIEAPWIERKWPAGERPHPRAAELLTLEGHTAPIFIVSVTPDGRRAVSGSRDRTLRVWDLGSGACLHTLEGHSGTIRRVSMTADGRRAVTGSDDKTLRVWDLESGACLHTLEGHIGVISGVSMTPDGCRAISGSWDKTLRIWDLESGVCLRTIEGHGSWFSSYVSMTPDGCRAITSGNKAFSVWDLNDGVCLRTLEVHGSAFRSVSMTPDGSRAVTGSEDKRLRVWDLDSGACLRTLEGHNDTILSVSMTPDGGRVVTTSDDKQLSVWDLESGACLRTLEGHSDTIFSVSMTPDGRRAVSGSRDYTLRVWDLESGACRRMSDGHSDVINSVTLLPDGRTAVSGGRDKMLRVWDLESGACLFAADDSSGAISSVSMTPGGWRAISCGWDLPLRVWDLESGACLLVIADGTGVFSVVSMTPDGRRAISGGWDKTLRVWDLESGACLRKLEGHTDVISGVSMTPDGCRAISGSWDKTLRVWDLESGACLRKLEGHTDEISGVSMTPDGCRAISGSWGKDLRVWDLEGGTSLHTLEGRGHVKDVSMTPDGRRAISGSWHNTLQVWDLESGACLGVYRTAAAIDHVAISHDGRSACLAVGRDLLVLKIHGAGGTG